MKTFDLEALSKLMGGEYVLGTKDLHSKACYMIYGRLKAGEGDRLIKPGDGYEEILCAVDGPLLIHAESGKQNLSRGHAMHIKQDEFFYISNPGEDLVRYILAGGRHSDQ